MKDAEDHYTRQAQRQQVIRKAIIAKRQERIESMAGAIARWHEVGTIMGDDTLNGTGKLGNQQTQNTWV